MKLRLRKLVALALVFAMLATVLPMNAIAVNVGRGVEKGEQAQSLAPVYPAISQAIPVDDELTVTVEAEEGAFPAGTAVTAEKVALENVQKAVDDTENVDGTVLYAVDITFTKDGAELQPAEGKRVFVRFSAPTLTDEAAVVHIDSETQKAEKVDTVETEKTDEVAFEAEKFSVYAVIGNVVPRLTVKFMNGETEIDHMFIKGSDTAEQVDKIIFDPGAGTIPSGQVFKGWVTEDKKNNYTADDLMTIDEVRSAAMTRVDALTSDGEVTYYAALFKPYNITYVDYVEVSGVTKTVTLGRAVVEAPSYDADASYTVNQGYSTDDTHDFEGWLVADGVSNITDTGLAGVTPAQIVPASQPNPTIFPNGTNIKVKGNVTFSVSAPEGHWLVFDENGKGATYNAPRFIKSGQTTQAAYDALLPMVRNGYSFGGWYTDAACTAGNEFVPGNTIDETTTIYAKWTAKTQADYTVLIWKQNVKGEDPETHEKLYDFVEAVRVQNAAVGSTPSAVNATTGAVTGASNTLPNGFHFENTDQASKTVAPEGNTVVNVYWDRNEYTLTFKNGQSNVSYTTKTYNNVDYQLARVGSYNNYTYYIQLDGKWYRITSSYNIGNYLWSNSYPISSNNSNPVNLTPGGSFYTVYNGNGNYTWRQFNIASTESTFTDTSIITTITALYEQDISSYFPITGYEGYVWDPQNSSVYTTGQVPSIESMKAENTVFQAMRYGTSTTIHFYYYTEAIGNETGVTTVPYNGKTYIEHQHVTITSNGGITSTETEDFIDIPGFAHAGSNPAYTNGQVSLNSSNNYTIRFYFDRKEYKLNFMDGAYYDGSGNQIMTETGQGQLREIKNIAYDASLTSYNKGGTAYYEPAAPAGYVFEGWYIDSACTHAYSFTTMPEGGLTVYAKWRQIQYRVFLHPNAETDTTLDWGSESQEMNFRVSYGGKVSVPDGQRTGYQFQGWYTDPDFANAFTASTVLNDSTVTAAYDKTTDLTDPMDKWGNVPASGTNSDVNRFWISKKLDLYAKWSVVLPGADGIGIIYDANGGTNEPEDTAIYVENSRVSAGAASTPPVTVPPAKEQVFDHWVLQSWDGTAYVDTNITVLPGESFDAKEEYARVQVKKYQHDWAILENTNPGDPENPIIEKIHHPEEEVSLAGYVDENEIDQEGNQPVRPTYAVEGATWEHEIIYLDATYTIQLKAVYKDKEEETPTHIDWYSNYGSENDGKGKLYHSYEGIKINEAVNIIAAPSRTGYAFKGWTKTKGGTTADFLVWTGTAYQTIDGTTVTQVAADEKQPYDDLFAVWEKLPPFTVYYSSEYDPVTNSMPAYTIQIADCPNGKVNLIKGGTYGAVTLPGVHEGYYYGGYYTDPPGTDEAGAEYLSWKGKTPGTVRGDTLTPEPGGTYYVKEVDAQKYLKLYYKFTYVKKTKRTTSLWVMTGLDDARYAEVGYVVFDTKLAGSAYGGDGGDKKYTRSSVYQKIKVQTYASAGEPGATYPVVPSDVCGTAELPTTARMTVIGAEEIFGGTNNYQALVSKEGVMRERAEFSIVPYWKTFDGVEVYAKKYRTYYIHVDQYTPAARSNDIDYPPKPAAVGE